MPHYVTAPPPVTVEIDGVPPRDYEIADVVRIAVDDAKLGAKLSDIELGLRILQAFPRGLAPGTVVDVDKDDHQRVAEILKNPSQGYKPIIARQVLPLIRAWIDAPTSKPEPAAPAPEEPAVDQPVVEAEATDAAAAEA